jgi:hypothetical protein
MLPTDNWWQSLCADSTSIRNAGMKIFIFWYSMRFTKHDLVRDNNRRGCQPPPLPAATGPSITRQANASCYHLSQVCRRLNDEYKNHNARQTHSTTPTTVTTLKKISPISSLACARLSLILDRRNESIRSRWFATAARAPANGAFGRQERQDSAGMRLVTAASR